MQRSAKSSYSNNSSFKKQAEKEKESVRTSQSKDKNIFYTQLKIQTHDKTVPLVRILKVEQELQNRFVHYFSYIQGLMSNLQMRALTKGFNRILKNSVTIDKYKQTLNNLMNVLTFQQRKRKHFSFLKLVNNLSKFRRKQSSVTMMKRFCLNVISNQFRIFFRNYSQKGLLSIVWEKSEQDQVVKLKMDIQILKRLIYSKQFIGVCKVFQKIAKGNMLQNQLNKNTLENAIDLELQRFQGIRQNQNQKQKQKVWFDNQIVLIALKNHGLAIKDLKAEFNQHITALQQEIQHLKSNEIIVSIKTQLNQFIAFSKSLQALANQFFRSDQQIRKVPQNNYTKLLSVLNSQQSKFQKLVQKSSKNDPTQSKFYQSRSYLISMAIKISNRQTFEQKYRHFVNQIGKIMNFIRNNHQLSILSQKYKKDNYEQALSNLVSCILQLHSQIARLQQVIKQQKQEKEKTIKQLEQSVSKSKEKLIQRKKQPQKQKPKPNVISQKPVAIIQKPMQQDSISWSEISSGIIQFINLTVDEFNKGRQISVNNKFLKLKKYSTKTIQLNNSLTKLIQILSSTMNDLQNASKTSDIRKLIELIRCFHLCWLQQNQYKKQWQDLIKNFKKQQTFDHTIKVLEEILEDNKKLRQKLKQDKSQVQKKEKVEDKSKQNQAFSRLLQQKMQLQKSYTQIQSKLFVKTQELKISIQKQKHVQKKVKELEQVLKKQQKLKKTLQSQIQAFNSNQESYISEIQIYKNNINAQLQQNSKLKKEISRLKTQLTSYQKKKQLNITQDSKHHERILKQEEMMKSNQELLLRQQFLSKEISIYESKIQQVNTNFNQSKKMVSDYKHKLTQKQHENQRILSQLEHLKAHLSAINLIEVNYKVQIQQLKQKIHQLNLINNNQINTESQDYQVFKFQNARLKAQNERLSYNVNRLNIFLEQVNSQKESLWRQNSEISNKLTQKDQLIDKLINDSKITINSISMKIVQSEKQSKQSVQRMQHILNQKQGIILQLEQQINQWTTKYKFLQSNVNLQTKITLNVNDQLHQNFSTVSGSLIQEKQILLLQEQVKSLQNYILILEDQIRKEKQKSILAIKNYEQLIEKVKIKEEIKVVPIKQTLSTLQNQKLAFQKEIQSLKQQIHKLYQILQQKTNLLNEAQLQNQHKFQVEKVHKAKILDLEALVQSLQKQIKRSSQPLQFSNERNYGLELNELKDNYSKLRTQYDIKNKQVQRTYIQKNKIMLENQSRMKNTIFSQQKQVQQLHIKIQSLNKQLQLYRTAKSQQQLETLSVLSNLQSTYLQIETKITQITQLNTSNNQDISIIELLKQIKLMLRDNQIFSQKVKIFYQSKKPEHADMDYVKQLIYSILKAFGQFSSQSQLASDILMQLSQITHSKNSIEEIFVSFQEYAINYLKNTLSTYKKQLRVKAIQLQEVKLKLQQLINDQLRHEHYLQNKFTGVNYLSTTGEKKFLYTPTNLNIKTDFTQHKPFVKFETSHVQRFNNFSSNEDYSLRR